MAPIRLPDDLAHVDAFAQAEFAVAPGFIVAHAEERGGRFAGQRQVRDAQLTVDDDEAAVLLDRQLERRRSADQGDRIGDGRRRRKHAVLENGNLGVVRHVLEERAERPEIPRRPVAGESHRRRRVRNYGRAPNQVVRTRLDGAAELVVARVLEKHRTRGRLGKVARPLAESFAHLHVGRPHHDIAGDLPRQLDSGRIGRRHRTEFDRA